MAVVEIRCPRCGAECKSSGKTKGDYHCEHCGATFHFIDSTKTMVTHDTQAHNCPNCGRPVKAEEGYMCMECGREDICSGCVKRVGDRFICSQCLKKDWLIVGPSEQCPNCRGPLSYIQQYSRWYCHRCNQYVKHLCQTCGTLVTYRNPQGTGYCSNCRTELTYQCPKCRGPLTYIPEHRRWFCNTCHKYA